MFNLVPLLLYSILFIIQNMFLKNFWFHINCAVNLSAAMMLDGNYGVGSLIKASEGLGHSISKRFLVDPESGTQLTVFIFGIGIPVDPSQQAVTVGISIRLLYHLPSNSSQYTDRIYADAPIIHSRYMRKTGRTVDNPVTRAGDDLGDSSKLSAYHGTIQNFKGNIIELNEMFPDRLQEGTQFSNTNEVAFKKDDDLGISKDIDELETSKFAETIGRQERVTRSLDAGANIVYEQLEHSFHKILAGKYKNTFQNAEMKHNITRWTLYRFLEYIIQRNGYNGRPCLLRTVCEAAGAPFLHTNGLLTELLHILFTPSTTSEGLSHHTDNEYHAAEALGRVEGHACTRVFTECAVSPLDLFTRVT